MSNNKRLIITKTIILKTPNKILKIKRNRHKIKMIMNINPNKNLRKFHLWYDILNFKITRQMKIELVEIGYSLEDIRHFTPL